MNPAFQKFGKQSSRGKMKTKKTVTLSFSTQINTPQKDIGKNSLWKQYIGKEDVKKPLKFGEQG